MLESNPFGVSSYNQSPYAYNYEKNGYQGGNYEQEINPYSGFSEEVGSNQQVGSNTSLSGSAFDGFSVPKNNGTGELIPSHTDYFGINDEAQNVCYFA